MGQPFFAASAAFVNVAASAFGTFPTTSRWMEVTVHPASVLSKFNLAFVSMESGVNPSFPSSPERAIEKQPACAAATSSSGFVPFAFSNRVVNPYAAFESAPLAEETTPFPSFRPPFHIALANRSMRIYPRPANPEPLLTLPHSQDLARLVDADPVHGVVEN